MGFGGVVIGAMAPRCIFSDTVVTGFGIYEDETYPAFQDSFRKKKDTVFSFYFENLIASLEMFLCTHFYS